MDSAELIHRLIGDGVGLVRAEVNLYKQLALHRASRARNGLIALAGGALLLLVGLIALTVMLASALAIHIGPIAAGLVIAGVCALVAWLLIRHGIGEMDALTGDAEEKASLLEGERLH